MRTELSFRRAAGGIVAFLLAATGGITINAISADRAEAAISPVLERPAEAVTADPLPTVQIDGMVRTQDIAGNRVYAGGQFSNARPAGAAAGTNQTPRRNLLAYDLTTGDLDTGFNPSPNAQVKSVAVSPDGSRLYVGGTFTSIAGATRYRIAAFNTATGALISSFAPVINSTVTAITATDTTVYVGGWFGVVNGNNRTRLAAFQASNGALLGWAPTADADITSMVLSPDGSKVVVGGAFQNVNGQPNVGVAAVSATTGATVSWPVNTVIRNGNDQAGTFSLSADEDTIYGTSYNYGTGNFEGQYAMNLDGSIKWLADCHGDTYAAFSMNGIVYGAGHPHYCANIGGFTEQSPRVEKRLMAFTKEATGTVATNGQGGAGYGNFAGYPSPSIISYFPDFTTGTISGASQAVWSLTGNGSYLAAGGEFPTAGGKAQQGLVRFAVRSIAPNAVKVKDLGGATNPSLVAVPGYGVRVNWKLNTDPDDKKLTYQVLRQDRSGTPLQTVAYESTWWQRPTVSFTDTTAVPGQTYRYRVTVADRDGNGTVSDWVPITMPSGTIPQYSKAILDDGAINYWPLDDADQPSMTDIAGGNQLTKQSGITEYSPGAISGEGATAASFDGSSVAGMTRTTVGPQTFAVETWIRTTTRRGGKIIGFGDSSTGTSNNYDRHVYMDNSGRLTFGVHPGGVRTVTTAGSYNDGQWHHLVAQLSPAGMSLWVDGVQRASNAAATGAQDYTGYWRLGGDNLSGWPNTGSSNRFNGQIDDTAIYPTALTAATIRDHYTKAGGSVSVPAEPADAYGKSVYADEPTIYWRLDDTGGPNIADSGTNLQPGKASGGVTYQTSSDVTAGGTGVTFDGSSGTIASANQFDSPGSFTAELWFSTTTTHGGKLIGFGDRQSGTSSNYDRHVYLENDGRVTFGTWTGSANTITTEQSFNDGEWHYLVASQGSDGMRLYLDGDQVGSHPQTAAQSYSGYWRIGGDSVWSGDSPYFAGSIDEAAVYPVQLSQARIQAHYAASELAEEPNTAPTAAFQATCDQLSCDVDAGASTDPDGTIADYHWDFGDGETASGATASHTYAAAGDQVVTLTVTDDQGATDSLQKTVTVTASPTGPVVIAEDDFDRSGTGWGEADTGGDWSYVGPSAFSTDGDSGNVRLSAGTSALASLGGVSAADFTFAIDISTDKLATGGGVNVGVIGRKIGNTFYSIKVRYLNSGGVHLVAARTVNNSETLIREINVSNLTYGPGDTLHFEASMTGASPTTLTGKVWKSGTAEPEQPQLRETDSTAILQSPGAVGIACYMSGTATNAPLTVSLDDLVVTETETP